jgi:putative transposase
MYETVRQWCRKFGQTYANELRHRRPRPGDKWYLDEVFISINGQVVLARVKIPVRPRPPWA